MRENVCLRDDTGRGEGVEQRERGVVPPVSELDDGSLVINVVKILVGIFVVIDDERATET